eukprot:4512080-Pleurochrysis_carterae.AAC.1
MCAASIRNYGSTGNGICHAKMCACMRLVTDQLSSPAGENPGRPAPVRSAADDSGSSDSSPRSTMMILSGRSFLPAAQRRRKVLSLTLERCATLWAGVESRVCRQPA